MKNVSNQFIETQDKVIRPATKLFFEVNSNVAEIANCRQYQPYPIDGFDYVAPVTEPYNCSNENYYAVLGADVPVGDPNRICAPYMIIGQFPTPDRSVPVGVTEYADAEEEIYVGCDENFAQNFNVSYKPITISFVGDYIPEYITIEFYDLTDHTWYTAVDIHNENLDREVSYVPSDRYYWGVFIRFRFRNDSRGGRYQLNWVRRDEHDAISFVDNFVSSVSITEETDLTSQSYPSYEMTVECIDASGSYSPNTDNWKKFTEGAPCYFKAGFSANGIPEYVSLFYGQLTQAPDYSMGKITFKVAFDVGKITRWRNEILPSISGDDLAVGDLALDRCFYDGTMFGMGGVIFAETDIFFDTDDEDNSVLNYYGKIEDVLKLFANALGGYMVADMNTVKLYNTIKVQYKAPIDYLTRYEQVQLSLENQTKVGTISVVRNENTMSAEYFDVVFDTVTIEAGGYVRLNAIIPFYAYAKVEINHTTLPSDVVFYDEYEELMNDGTTKVFVGFENTSASSVTFTPEVRYYKVENTKFTETETLDSKAGETYSNDNDLVTNGYIVEKIKRVARFIAETTEHYEIDVIQDFRYEIGDVIRVETERNVFRTCIITGLKFTFPGSKGRVTCRRIFTLEDTPESVVDEIGFVYFINSSAHTRRQTLTVIKTESGATLAGSFKDNVNEKTILVVLGGTKFKYKPSGGSETEVAPDIVITDKNNHIWYAKTLNDGLTTYAGDVTKMVALPDYNDTTDIDNALAYGVINLIKAAYEAQGMTAPVDYNCEYDILT